jgi:antitoxin component YwqK of YwqJK toxin-antitoxin module
MKNFSVIIILLLFLLSCNNDLKRIELYNSKGNISELYYLDKNNKKQGLDILYYENGNKQLTVEFKNDIPFGNVYSYFSNKKLKKKFTLFDKIHRDTFYKFSENGNLNFKAIYGIGGKESIIKKCNYYSNGKLKREVSSVEGREIDIFTSSRVKYFSSGKIDFHNSNFVKIQYINKIGNKIRFTICRSEIYNTPGYEILESMAVYLKYNFNHDFTLKDKFLRIIQIPKNKSFEITFLPTDYINGKLNIVLVEKIKHKFENNNLLHNIYNIQLIKGDKSRWHNVHGIVKEGNESLLH